MTRGVLVAPLAVLLALGCNGNGDPNGLDRKQPSSTAPAATTPPPGPNPNPNPTPTPSPNPGPAPGALEVMFAPNGAAHDLQKAVAAQLDAATQTIDIAMFNFTSPTIGDAVIRAHKRGVAVRVIFDEYQSKLAVSLDVDFKAKGVPLHYMNPTSTAVKYLKFHHKFGVIDGKLVITGSYNWTSSADEENYENAVFIRDPGFVAAYSKEFDAIWTTGKSGGTSSTNDLIFAPTGSGAMQDKIVTEIGKAQKEIVIAMYQFTSTKVSKAVAAAVKRGVAVSVLTDASQASLNQSSLTTMAGAQTKKVYLQGDALFHQKYCVIDGKTLIFGSFNWNVNQDLYGYESIQIIRDPGLCQKFINDFGQVWNSSVAK